MQPLNPIRLSIQEDITTKGGPELIILTPIHAHDGLYFSMNSYPGYSDSLREWPSGCSEEQRRWGDLIREAILAAYDIGAVSIEADIDSPIGMESHVPPNPRWYKNLLAKNGFKIRRRGPFARVMVADLHKPKKKGK